MLRMWNIGSRVGEISELGTAFDSYIVGGEICYETCSLFLMFTSSRRCIHPVWTADKGRVDIFH